MRFAGRKCLLVITSATLLACSGSGGGNSIASQSNEGAEAAANFAADQSASDVARSLCIDSARRRFGISPDDVASSTFLGGGESPRTVEGQLNFHLFGPPARYFRCELAGGAVASIRETDENGNPAAQR